MSNEEVVLQMVVNRLNLLLEGSQELKSKWNAEITEIILLGSGVAVSSGLFERTLDGKWLLPVSIDELSCLASIVEGENSYEDFTAVLTVPLTRRISDLLDQAQIQGPDGDQDEGRVDLTDEMEEREITVPDVVNLENVMGLVELSTNIREWNWGVRDLARPDPLGPLG